MIINSGFHSFRTRLLVFLLVLFVPVLLGIYLYVSYQNQQYTDETINSYLQIGADVFDFSREEHKNTLLTLTSTLTRDWGFRNAFGTADRATILDAAETLLVRSMGSADMLMIADMSGEVIIDTADQGMARLRGGWAEVVELASQDPDGIGGAVLTIEGVPYQITVLPLYLPTPVAWIFGGFAMDDNFASTVKQSIASDVSVVRYQRGTDGAMQAEVIASTLVEKDQTLLVQGLDLGRYAETQRVRLSDSDYGTMVRPLYGSPGADLEVLAVIQRSYRENEENLAVFQARLLQFSLIVLLISVAASVALSRSVTRPVLALVRRVRRIEQGDFAQIADEGRALRSKDEIGQLARSVDAMAAGLAEKEKVRALLGKVVSHEIAEELLKRRIDLGGEERIVSVLFVDIQGYTSVCEGKSPSDVLVLLNGYLSRITEAIERSGGVVDKFTGDAVMALFGAPLTHEDDAFRAVRAVLSVQEAIADVNAGSIEKGTALKAGIGLHTGLVVAGNMGSASRMNYTVIGDTVNIAARLESLTRHYGVQNLVTEATRRACGDDFEWCEVDLVRVKGRQEPVRIHELLGRAGDVDSGVLAAAQAFEAMLVQFRQQNWTHSLDILHGLQSKQDRKLYRMYIERIEHWRENPPKSWDGVYTFEQK